MRLFNAARFFDRLEVRDAYSGKFLFRGQFDVFDDSERDAIGIQRRTLSVTPGVKLPSRYALEAPTGIHWIAGALGNVDVFSNSSIREKYTLHRAVGLARVYTPGNLILDGASVSAYAGSAWLKDWREESVSSDAYPYYELFFGASENVQVGDYVLLNGDTYRVRSTYRSEAGFLVAEADDLAAAKTTITLLRKTYDPLTDLETENPEEVGALVFRFLANYRYLQSSAPKFEPGDYVCLVPKATAASLSEGSEVQYAGRTFRAISIDTESDCWRLHLRP